MKLVHAVVAVMILLAPAVAQQQRSTVDSRLMTRAQYSAYLNRLEKALPEWERQFRRIDAAQMPDMSYSTGTSVMNDRNTTLTSIETLQAAITAERAERKLSREFVMAQCVDSIIEGLASLGELLQGSGTKSAEANAWLWDTIPLFKELGSYRGPLLNDIQARIELLEVQRCD